jgi:two-component system, chemotaxis family, protein-glutamate methylesterase/glutaminase
MDVELPGMDGLAAIEEIMSRRPLPILVISVDAGHTSRKAAAALAAGALEAISKDDLDLDDPGGAAAAAFRNRARLLSHAPVIRHPRARLRKTPVPQRPQRPGRRASVIGMCGSTGGPYVLSRLLGDLPAEYPIPILVVQHISAGFTDGLVHWLDQSVPLPVRIAADGAPLRPGVWIAPEGAHLKLAPTGRLRLDALTVVGHHRPSGDVLFESIAEAAADTGVAVVLSGMGNDGARGASAVRRSGGLVIAQDQESSAVFGMPKAAIDSGADMVLSPSEIAARLVGLRYQPMART